MDWIMEIAEFYRAQLRQAPFFQHVAQMATRKDLAWTGQLVHQSREFTQALCLRYSLCTDAEYQAEFAEHTFGEADHPDQLLAWMAQHELPYANQPALPQTLHCLAFLWRSALRENDPRNRRLQSITMNLMSEGIALDFYTAVIPALERMGLLTGRYWKVHREVDAQHLRIGMDGIPPRNFVSPEVAAAYHERCRVVAELYHLMMSAWVGVVPEPLATLHAT